MRSIFSCFLFVLFSIQYSSAQERRPDGGGAVEAPKDYISDTMRAEIRTQIQANIDSLKKVGNLSSAKPQQVLKFDWPLRAGNNLFDYDYHGVSNFVDRNIAFPNQITDYMCGTRSYDLDSGYNHSGVDFFTWPFGWNKVQDDAVAVVAAAPGTIVQKIDGNQDQSCSFNNTQWNAVYVRHSDCSVAWYGHMKKNSTTGKSVGEQVAAGEYLGIVGSSGNSTGPHLHFELQDANGVILDPFKGECNPIEESLWNEQRAYFDSGINAMRTQSEGPVFTACPNPDVPNYQDAFKKGANLTTAVYFRDQLEGQTAFYAVKEPSGAVRWSWNHTLRDVEHYAASYWWWRNEIAIDAPVGVWEFEVSFINEVYTHVFSVSDVTTKPLPVYLQNPGNEVQVEEDEVVLRWLPLADADEYELVIASDSEFTNIVAQYAFDQRSVTLQGLDVGEKFYWRVRAKNGIGVGEWSLSRSFNTGISTSGEEDQVYLPEGFHLSQNYPNPFNPTTEIQYLIPRQSNIQLSVHNVLGKRVAELVNEAQSAGTYTVTFDASRLPSGVYYLKLESDEFTEVKPMTLIK